MNAQSEALQESLKEAIKAVLKNQKKNYTDLAEELDISVPTVKRILTKEELSLTRLLHICSYLKLSLTDLEKIAMHNRGVKNNTFSEKQDEFLAKNPNFITFLVMMYSGLSPEEIQKKTRLSERSLKLYLLRLEKLELIHYHKGKYHTPQESFPGLIPYGKMHQAHFLNVIESGAEFFKRYSRQRILAKNSDRDRGSTMGLVMLSMSRKSYLEWFDKLKKLFQEIQAISLVEEKMPKLKDKTTVVLLNCTGTIDANDPEHEFLQSSFGKVTEIS